MKRTRSWPRVIAGIVAVLLGVFLMGTETGSAQWIIGLVVVIAGVVLLAWTLVNSRRED